MKFGAAVLACIFSMMLASCASGSRSVARTERRADEAAARRQPSVMLFEDLQWADPTTLGCLRAAASVRSTRARRVSSLCFCGVIEVSP